MDDMQALIEEFFDELREIVRPTPKPKRAGKITFTGVVFVLATVVAAVGWELHKAPHIPSST